MLTARAFHTATLLNSGQVLVTGGLTFDYAILSTCELYDPITNKWNFAGNLTTPRESHTATLLDTGTVLVTSYVNTSEVYDPLTGEWTFSTSMKSDSRYYPTANLLKTGEIIVIAGIQNGQYSCTTEVYDSYVSLWDITDSMATKRISHTSVGLNSDQVLVTDGYGYLASSEIYDPITEQWTYAALLSIAFHTVTLLDSGKVLIVGDEHIDFN